MAWAISILIFITTHNPLVALYSAKAYYLASSLYTVALLLFAYHYPRGGRVPVGGAVCIIGAWLSLAVCILGLDGFMVESFARTSYGTWRGTINPPGYLLFSAFFVSMFFSGIGIVLYKYMHYSGAERMRASFYAFSMLAISIPGFVANLLLPFFGNYDYVWVGPVASIAVAIAICYSAFRHRLLDIKLFFAKLLVYGLSLVALALFYVGTLWLLALTVFSTIDPRVQQAINFMIMIIAAVSFQPMREFFDKITNNLLYRDRYDLQDAIDKVTAACVERTDIPSLAMAIKGIMAATINPTFLAIVFVHSRHAPFIYGEVPRKYLRPEWLKAHTGIIHNAADPRIFTLETSAQTIGYFVVGGTHDERPYTRRDYQLMALIVNELSVAIQNIFRLEEIRSFARTLESEVNTATRQLRRSNKRLLELDATKDEFISMASHQLRTPLTSIKGYISMVLEGDVGEISDGQRHLLKEAFDSSERMVRLIADFLNVSRLQTGKFMIDRQPTDIEKMVTGEVDQIRPLAKSHMLRIDYKASARLPMLYVDEDKISQVVMNFIDNAIYYSHEGGVVTVRLTVEDGDVVVRVQDQGIGVPADVQARLFTRYFRADNARKQRPDGTGIGLYLAKKIIDGHKGGIIFESKVGKGSLFGFRLPIKKLSTPPRRQPADTLNAINK